MDKWRMLPLWLLALAVTTPAAAQQLTLQTGPPAAAMPDPFAAGEKKVKDVTFVVRSAGCADRTAFRLIASAESVEGGVRRSVDLKAVSLPQEGVFAVRAPGVRVVSLSATCGPLVAGATVSLADGVYRREGVELLAHHPKSSDIERALARFAGGGQR